MNVYAELYELDNQIIPEAMFKLALNGIENFRWYAWYALFGSSAGPKEHEIGLCVMTEFQVFGFKNIITNKSIKYCRGVWKDWDGNTNYGW